MRSGVAYENEALKSENDRLRKIIRRKEKALTDINDYMWNTWGIKNASFGRDQGAKIMEILNDEAEADI